MHLDTALPTPLAGAPPRDVARALAFIDAHACDPELCASGVQDALGLRASGFRTRFRQATGRTLGDYVEARRIEAACGLLRAGALVGDAALAVGYRSHETFTRAFVRAMETAPGRYRSAHVGGAKNASKIVKT